MLEPLESPNNEKLEELNELNELSNDVNISEELDLLKKTHESSFESLSGCFGNADVPVIIMNDHLSVLWENGSFTELFGYGEESRGKNFTSLFSNFSNSVMIRELFTSIRNGNEKYSWKGILQKKDSRHLDVIAKCSILPLTPEKARKYYVALFTDISSENKNTLRNTYLSLLEASKLKDNDTGKHIQRVGEYAKHMADFLYNIKNNSEVNMEFIENIGFLAQMHDVGKIGTPDDILNKEGSLESWEWKIMKEHTLNGAYILSNYPDPMAKQIALFHHERWNGEGYPYELAGNDIPLAARIVAIADVYDALRMKRSYKRAYDHRETVAQINTSSGIHFDPYLVDVFNKLEKEFEIIHNVLAD
ncbi:MAG: HD domain-containing protein [Spirochaetales bacterium]|nr:HD domain-containing protein [Spirochaetales bacterium]